MKHHTSGFFVGLPGQMYDRPRQLGASGPATRMEPAGGTGWQGKGTDRMVLGIVRERARQVAPEAVEPLAPSDRHSEGGWRAERGRVRMECQVDVIGGFPGSASYGGRLDGAQLRITDRYLLVDEGRAHGFGLPIGWLCGARPVAQFDRPDAALRLRYLDGAVGRGFVLKFRGALLQLRGSRRAEQALAALRAVGLPENAVGAASADPGLHLDWEEAARYEQENVIWSGAVTAPIGTGLERGACNIWLTTRSVIWGSGTGKGIYRAGLEQIRDVAAVDTRGRTTTPALIVGVEDAAGDRHDLTLLFNRQTPERDIRERGACLVGLRSRGIPLGVPPSPVQPWQPVSLVLPDPPTPPRSEPITVEPPPADLNSSPLSADPPVDSTDDLPSVAATPNLLSANVTTDAPQVVEPGPLPIVAGFPPDAPGDLEESPLAAAPSPLEERADDPGAGDIAVPVVALTPAEPDPEPAATVVMPASIDPMPVSPGWPTAAPPIPSDPEEPAVVEASSAPESVVLPNPIIAPPVLPAVTRGPAVTPGLEQAEVYEAAARRLLTEVLQAIDARVAGQDVPSLIAVLPSEAQRLAAFSEIGNREKSGELSRQEAASRRARLVAVGEAGPRLRSLLELHDSGWLSDDALVKKRQAITDQLNRLLDDPSPIT